MVWFMVKNERRSPEQGLFLLFAENTWALMKKLILYFRKENENEETEFGK
jgi:hypothetical protein